MSLLSNYLPRGIVPVSQMTITESLVVNLAESQLALVVLVGGGGAGGLAVPAPSSTTAYTCQAQGGNAGGVCMQLLRFKASTDYTFTIGAGGTAPSRSTAGANSGGNGGNTTLASTAISTITANGGTGGAASSSNVSASTFDTDHARQTANGGSGADIIFSGGQGGAITTVQKNSGCEHVMATGGGAANLLGLPVDEVSGGDAEVTQAVMERHGLATGGGGVGGRGGDATDTSTGGTQQEAATGGGGAAGRGTDFSGTPGAIETAGGLGSLIIPQVLFSLDGAGSDGSYGNNGTPSAPGDGAGCGGWASGYGNFTGGTMTAAGAFGGGGGWADNDGVVAGIGSAGNYGGGGGGFATMGGQLSSGTKQSGPGGAGVAFVFFLSDFGKVLI